MKIGKHTVGDSHPCLIIAEAGVNHNGSLDVALRLVESASQAGADIVKFQTFKAASVVTRRAPKAAYQLEVTDAAESQLQMLESLELSLEEYRKIISHCEQIGITFLSTPYNRQDANFLNDLGVSAFKVASGQLVEHDFLEYLAAFDKPLILSTGMATLGEVYAATQVLRALDFHDFIVLQCTTNYPASVENANIRAMQSMRQALDVVVGYSDHVPSNYACYAAVATGAAVIEKHFTLDKSMPGPDHKASLDPSEFATLVTGVRAVEASLGSGVKTPSAAEIRNTEGMRRSIVVISDKPAGHTLTRSDLEFKRPATGIAPRFIDEVVGATLSMDIEADTILLPHHLIQDFTWWKA